MAWATKDFARRHWSDAIGLDDVDLDDLLDAAQEQCAAYAPMTAEPVPVSFMLAVVYQAREIWAAASRDSQDVIGFGDYAIRARPMTAAVKSLLRPERRGVIG